MYNVTVKSLAVALCVSLFAVSCNSGKSDEQIQAEKILSEAQSFYNSENYEEAIHSIDSLTRNFPGIIDVQRNAMHLKTLVTEKITILDSINNDLEIEKNIGLVDSLQSSFKFVKTKDMVEGYYVHKQTPTNNLIKQNNVEARIDEFGKIYLISNLYGKSCKHTHLVAKSKNGQVQTGIVAYDNAMNYRFKDAGTPVEMVTFNAEKCDTLCNFISANRNEAIKLQFKGSRTQEITLSKQTKKLIDETYRFAKQKAALKKAQDLRMFYTRKLQITRKQQRQTATNLTGEQQN